MSLAMESVFHFYMFIFEVNSIFPGRTHGRFAIPKARQPCLILPGRGPSGCDALKNGTNLHVGKLHGYLHGAATANAYESSQLCQGTPAVAKPEVQFLNVWCVCVKKV